MIRLIHSCNGYMALFAISESFIDMLYLGSSLCSLNQTGTKVFGCRTKNVFNYQAELYTDECSRFTFLLRVDVLYVFCCRLLFFCEVFHVL